jgi:hypothetical protein
VKSIKEKKQEEQEITLLQSKASINSPNFAILDKLKTEMRKLKEFKVRCALCKVLCYLKGLIGFCDEHGFAVNVLSFKLREGNRTTLCKILRLLDCVYLVQY